MNKKGGYVGGFYSSILVVNHSNTLAIVEVFSIITFLLYTHLICMFSSFPFFFFLFFLSLNFWRQFIIDFRVKVDKKPFKIGLETLN